MNLHLAERISQIIESARLRTNGEMDMHDLYVRVLVRCGLCPDEASTVVSNSPDPIQNILHFAGESHNYALLAVTESLAEAC